MAIAFERQEDGEAVDRLSEKNTALRLVAKSVPAIALQVAENWERFICDCHPFDFAQGRLRSSSQ